jgi:hypothetical protein
MLLILNDIPASDRPLFSSFRNTCFYALLGPLRRDKRNLAIEVLAQKKHLRILLITHDIPAWNVCYVSLGATLPGDLESSTNARAAQTEVGLDDSLIGDEVSGGVA